MKFLLLIAALLPCLTAEKLRNVITCPDGLQCAFGQTCCKSESGFECCGLPETELLNKKLLSAYSSGMCQAPSGASIEKSTATCDNFTCAGTCCGENSCCPLQQAECCPSNHCCPSDGQCCTLQLNGTDASWCCKKQKERCYKAVGYCVAGAASLQPAIVVMLLAAIFLVSLKR